MQNNLDAATFLPNALVLPQLLETHVDRIIFPEKSIETSQAYDYREIFCWPAIQNLQVRSSVQLSRVSWYKCQRSELTLERKCMNTNFVSAGKTVKWSNFYKATLLSILYFFCFRLVGMGRADSLLNWPQTPYTTKDDLKSRSSRIHHPCVGNTCNYVTTSGLSLWMSFTVTDKSKLRCMTISVCIQMEAVIWGAAI